MTESPRASILVVDDDTNLLDLLVDTLDAIGYQVTGVSDGAQALEALRRDTFDLTITDIKMPRLDGIALLKRIRRYYPDMPVLFITGLESPEIIGQATADGFLAKPFRISRIEELIENTLAGKHEKFERPTRKILIVDDDHSFRQALAEMLLANDYSPVAVENAEQALRELENGRLDAAVIDIKMPGMDGIDLMRRIRERYPELPIIIATAYYSPEDTAHLAPDAEPPDGFLQKPFRTEAIVQLLESLQTATTADPD